MNNSGLSPDLLTSLVGSLTQAQPSQISSVIPSPISLSPTNENPPADQNVPADNSSMTSKTWLLIGGAVLGVILLIFLLRK